MWCYGVIGHYPVVNGIGAVWCYGVIGHYPVVNGIRKINVMSVNMPNIIYTAFMECPPCSVIFLIATRHSVLQIVHDGCHIE